MGNILELKISLADIEPEIWRKIQVTDATTFKKLHEIIQIVMGWENYHLYEFEIDGTVIEADKGEGFNPAEGSLRMITRSEKFQELVSKAMGSGKEGLISLNPLEMMKIHKEEKEKRSKSKKLYDINTPLSTAIKVEGETFIYVYDLGDNWEHIIKVEKIFQKTTAKKIYPLCLEGERACPPEDCGSVSGYYELMEIRENKDHPEYEESIVEWLGEDYDPEYFNVDRVNKELKPIRYGRSAFGHWSPM